MESEVSSPGEVPDQDASQCEGIVATGLARFFGPVRAVENIDFHAMPGQVTALIGPNGSGKTTLLLMLASLLRPDSGSIRINGYDPVANPQAVRAVLGWMPDTLGMWESLKAREILVTVAALYGMDKTRAANRVVELLELVNLSDMADTPARVFSRGQAQRLSLARALINDPAVLLLDEPASGLDPGARIQLRQILRQLADSGKTVVVSSHVLAELDEMADAAVFLAKGRTVRSQTLDEAGKQVRGYSISTFDLGELRRVLEANQILATYQPYFDSPRGTAKTKLADEAEAAALLGTLVAAGVPVTAFGPSSGVLEETYLSLEEGTR